MNVIPISAHAGITGFESPAAEYRQLSLNLDELLVEHPSATFWGVRMETRCKASVFSMVIF